MNLKICCIIIANGSRGETHFALRVASHNEIIQQKAIRGVFSSELLEWYRNQYNIPLHTFMEMNLDEDIILMDYYRRQYWNEVRFGVRNWGDESVDFKMPSFMFFRQFGGTLPPPNGFELQNEYTVKAESYKMPSTTEVESRGLRISRKNVYDGSNGDPMTGGANQESVYEMDQKTFAELLKQADDPEFWETVDEFNSGA